MKDNSRNYISPVELKKNPWYTVQKTYICDSFRLEFINAQENGELTKICGDLHLGNNNYLQIEAIVKSIDKGYKGYGEYGLPAGIIESPTCLRGRKIVLAKDWVSWYLGIGSVEEEKEFPKNSLVKL